MRKPALLSALVVMLVGISCNNNNSAVKDNSNDTVVAREVSSQIVYIRVDSLMTHYDMYNDLMAEFEEKAKKADNDVMSRGRSLERAAQDAQSRYERGLVTQSEAMKLQEDLQRREQGFYEFREKVQRELAEENQVLTNKIFFSMEDYIQEFNSDYRYGMILTTSGGAPILHADPALDITDIVLKGLNEKYAQEKKQNK